MLRLVFVRRDWVDIDIHDSEKRTDIRSRRSGFLAELAKGCIGDTWIRVLNMPARLYPSANLFVPENDQPRLVRVDSHAACCHMPIRGIAGQWILSIRLKETQGSR